MITTLYAIAPIFILIALGFGLKQIKLVEDVFWVPAERLTYYVLYPSLLVSTMAEANLAGTPVLGLIAVQGLALFATIVLLLLISPLLRRPPFALDGASYSSVFQGIQRPNTYVAFAAAGSLYGQPGLALTALCATIIIPMVNVASAIGVIHWAHPKLEKRGMVILKALLTNPLIISCLVGGVLNGSGIGLSPILATTLKILGQASLSFGLLVVGAGITFATLKDHPWALGVTSIYKLLVLPLAVGLIGWWWGIAPIALSVAVLYASVPTSASAYVMARQMRGDHALMAAIITVTTVVAIVTIPFVLHVSGYFIGG